MQPYHNTETSVQSPFNAKQTVHTLEEDTTRLTAIQSWYSRNPEKVLYFQVLP